MGQAPSGMRLKSISAIGSTRFPTKPTLNSRPPMYSCTSTSSNCSVMAARRARSDLRSLTSEPGSGAGLAARAGCWAGADLADLVAHRGEDRADLVHGFHHAADVLRRPVFGARVEQDDDLHAPTTARCWAGTARRVPASTVSSCPVSRRQAIRTTSWI